MKTLLITDIKGNAKINVVNRSKNDNVDIVSNSVDSIRMYQTYIYNIKLTDTVNDVDFERTIINPDFADKFIILRVKDGYVTILPIIDGFKLEDNTVIGALC